MKQFFHFSLLLLALLLPATATAYDFEVDGIYYNINGNEVEVTHGKDIYSRYHGAVTIPASVTYNGTTYPVTAIGQSAFARCSALTSVEIPNSVTSIGRWAFTGCTGLTGIVVESGNATFDSRDNSNAIIETASNTLIVGCKNTTIPNSVTTIGDEAFANNSGLTSIDIPNSVTSIGHQAFVYCSGLTSIDIPNSVTEIGMLAFAECTGLTGIVVESGNPRFDSRDNCNAIIETAVNTLFLGCKNTIIPNSVTAIGDRAFAYCHGLTSIDIPNSVTAIGDQAFDGCDGLTSIDIPNSVTEIGMYAFSDCSGLTSTVVESGNPRYDSRNNCNAIIETASNTLIVGCMNTIIPNSVTAIGHAAFYGCTGLPSIDIPSSVTSIDDEAFYDCFGLMDVYCYIADFSRVSSGYYQFSLNNSYYSGRTLHVLQGTADAYRADENWYPYFGQIVEDIFIGDVNRDLEVNIADVNAVINIILGGNGSTSAADVNGDGEINIADINAVIDIILRGTGN